MSKLFFFFCLAALFVFQGCALISKAPQLLTLKRLGDSQDQMARYIEKQKKNLNKLISDVNDGKLHKGLSYQEIITAYGGPVLSWDRDPEQKGISKELLYRHPTEYFDTDRIYLYFGQDLKLSGWDYQPAQTP